MIGIKVKTDDKYAYVTMNYRHIVENGWSSDLKYRCEPTEYHEKRITAKFILSRGIANEFVRHREFSFLQESTRYCNYSKDKFSGITFIASSDCHLNTGEYKMSDTSELVGDGFIADPFDDNLDAVQLLALTYFETEATYFELINRGVKPQIARDVLPLGLKTELIMTGTESQWGSFFKLRCAPNVHPDARKLAIELRNLMGIH